LQWAKIFETRLPRFQKKQFRSVNFHIMKKIHLLAMSAVLPFTALQAQITFNSGVSLPYGGEIVSYTNGQLLTTNSGNGSHGVQSYSLSGSGALTAGLSIDLGSVFGAASTSSITSVYADARGFGVASIVPTAKTSTDYGRIAFFDLSSGSILKTLDVGYHPDSVTMTPDGTKLLVANEGEYVAAVESTFARPGSVSVINLSGITNASGLSALNSGNVTTYDFSSGNLGSGVSLQGVRDNTLATNNATTSAGFANIEAEYIAPTNDKAYVTLQENNAIAVLDFASGKYEAIHKLGTITQTVDASDKDGAGGNKTIAINDTLKGLPMPDTMVLFTKNGTTLLATANEGDARPDDGDFATGSSLTANMTAAVAATATDTGIGALKLLKDQGQDADGKIADPTMLGTRSFSLWNATTGERVFDSGSAIEQYVASNDPTVFNTNDGVASKWDTRSDDKGPEPEALAFGRIDGKDFIFVGAERQNGIFQFDITDLSNVSIVGYFNPVTSTADSGGSFISPESILFLDAASNPSGKNLLVVGFEGTGSNGSIGVFEVVPEPQTYILLGIAAAFLLWRARRRAC
jgi:hypothetical protein